MTKPAPTRKLFKRAPGKAADLKRVRKGTKRETLLSLLHAGASYDQIAKTCVKKDGTPWTKAATKSACTTWACSLGYGVTETEPGHFQLVLPKGITTPVIS